MQQRKGRRESRALPRVLWRPWVMVVLLVLHVWERSLEPFLAHSAQRTSAFLNQLVLDIARRRGLAAHRKLRRTKRRQIRQDRWRRQAQKHSEHGFSILRSWTTRISAVARQAYDLSQYYIDKSDVWIISVAASFEHFFAELRLGLESINRRLGIQIRGASAWIRVKGKAWEFVILTPEVMRSISKQLPASEIEYLWGQIHEHHTPLKFLSLLEKTQAGVNKYAEWCQAEFDRTKGDWKTYIPDATLEPESWREALEWMIETVGRQHLSWNTWIVVPRELLPRTVIKALLDHVGESGSIFLDRVEFETLLFKLFNNLVDSEPSHLEAFADFQRRIMGGSGAWDVLLPDLISVQDGGMVTSSGVWMNTINIHTLGVDRVTYTQKRMVKKDGKDTEIEVHIPKTFMRDLEWLKQQLTPCLLADNRRDQQVWVSASVIGIPPGGRFLTWLERNLRILKIWSDEQAAEVANESLRHYRDVIKSAHDELKGHEHLKAFQQSIVLLLKAADQDSLKALQDRVTAVLNGRNVFYSQAAHSYQHWHNLKRMLPVVWPEEVTERNDVIRSTMPMTLPDLHSLLKVPEIHIPEVGGVVGIQGDGLPLVIGPGNFGVPGTTEVGKSMALKDVVSMLYPLAPAETEVFVIDIIGAKPGAELKGWGTLLVDLFGGKVFFPSEYPSPKAFRQHLDSCLDCMVFLYYPDEDYENAEAYDEQFLHFALARAALTNREERVDRSNGDHQLVLPSLESLVNNQLHPPRKRIRRRLFILDELETWLQDSEDKRATFLTNRIMSQARKYDMTCMYSVKTMESAMNVNPGVWSSLKNITDKGWYLFWTPDAERVPETITYPRNTAEGSRRADQIVTMISDIRKLGGMTDVTETYGRCVYATGEYITYANFIVPPQMLEAMERKSIREWGG